MFKVNSEIDLYVYAHPIKFKHESREQSIGTNSIWIVLDLPASIPC